MKSKKSAAEITLAAIENAHAIALIEKEFIECSWSENQIAESILSPGYTFFAALVGGELVGYIGVEWCFDEGNICNVAVEEKARRRGIGAMLVEAVTNEAKSRGAAKLFLEVNENNAAAIALYEKQGFSVLYRRPNYYGSAAALVMTKQLN